MVLILARERVINSTNYKKNQANKRCLTCDKQSEKSKVNLVCTFAQSFTSPKSRHCLPCQDILVTRSLSHNLFRLFCQVYIWEHKFYFLSFLSFAGKWQFWNTRWFSLHHKTRPKGKQINIKEGPILRLHYFKIKIFSPYIIKRDFLIAAYLSTQSFH